MSSLFDEFERTDASVKKYAESDFAFLNRSASPACQQVRQVLDAWFSALPKGAQCDLGGRFHDRRGWQHATAFWELYLHETFRRLGFTIQTHPPAPSGNPDFLVTRGSEAFYLEAVMVYDAGDEQRRLQLRAELQDAINDRVHHPQFLVHFEVVRDGTATIKLKPLCEKLQQWLDSLDHDQVLARVQRTVSLASLSSPMPSWEWAEGSWMLHFDAIPLPHPTSDPSAGRIIGVGPAYGLLVDDYRPIYKRLYEKSKKYGALDKPYVIALSYNRPFSDVSQLLSALYGDYADGSPGLQTGWLESWWPRDRETLWATPEGPKGQQVSAILSAIRLDEYRIASIEPTLWLNPWAQEPITISLPFENVTVANGSFRKIPATVRPRELFELSPSWPTAS